MTAQDDRRAEIAAATPLTDISVAYLRGERARFTDFPLTLPPPTFTLDPIVYFRAGEWNRPPTWRERWSTPRVRRVATICALTVSTVAALALR